MDPSVRTFDDRICSSLTVSSMYKFHRRTLFVHRYTLLGAFNWFFSVTLFYTDLRELEFHTKRQRLTSNVRDSIICNVDDAVMNKIFARTPLKILSMLGF